MSRFRIHNPPGPDAPPRTIAIVDTQRGGEFAYVPDRDRATAEYLCALMNAIGPVRWWDVPRLPKPSRKPLVFAFLAGLAIGLSVAIAYAV